MATKALNTGYPTGPLMGGSGLPTPAWTGFFLALYRRTGEGTGASIEQVEQELAQETAARQAADAALTSAISAENTARLQADANEAAARAAADAKLQSEIDALPTSAGNMRTAWWFWK